jgi:3-isopropylmalate/(R)-2-methylmalate dehydratase small subunit
MSDLLQVFRGRVWLLGDSVDTNQLAPSGLAGASAAQRMREHCLRGLRPEFREQVKPGDILVAGANFGCGSSRQSAVEALQLSGISVVLAESVARIHRRNSIALALPTFVVPDITSLVADGDELEVDYAAREVRDLTRGTRAALPELPPSVERVYRAGGLFNVIKERLAEQGFVAPAEVGA